MDHSKPLIVPAGADALGQIGLYLIYVVILLLLQGVYSVVFVPLCFRVCVLFACVTVYPSVYMTKRFLQVFLPSHRVTSARSVQSTL